jgi:hypothetical protein
MTDRLCHFAKQPILQPDLRWNRRPAIDRVRYLGIFVMLRAISLLSPLPAMCTINSLTIRPILLPLLI